MRDPRARPVIRRPRKGDDKPPMPKFLEPEAEKAKARNRRRYAQPGLAVEVEKTSPTSYRVVSPHADLDSWEAMVFDALGTRSESTGMTFIYQLSALCTEHWLPSDEEGHFEWAPDERELNMILAMVGSIRPKNEMQAALGAQMVAVHLMTMRAASKALASGWLDERMAAIAGKLARTFAMQTDTMSRLKGKRRTSKQLITVKYERHDHQHVHVTGGQQDFGGQPYEAGRDCGVQKSKRAGEPEGCATLPSPNAPGNVVPLSRDAGPLALPNPRGKRGRS